MHLFRRIAAAPAPHIRISLIHHRLCKSRLHKQPSTPIVQGRRNFHVGSSIGEVVRATAESISWVHSIGVPWYITIPLVAIGVNVTVRLPLQYYAHSLRVRRNELSPLVTAWNLRHSLRMADSLKTSSKNSRQLQLLRATMQSSRRIYKNWRIQQYKGFAPLLGAFPFVVVSEALRRQCGAPMGWFSHSIGLGGEGPKLLFEESLTNGGLLWFTNLTSMDPYLTLPLLCTGILGYTYWSKLSKNHLKALLTAGVHPEVVLTPWQKVFGRVLLVVPFFPMVFSDLPSAIFLYWACTFSLTAINARILERWVPTKPSSLKANLKRPNARPYLIGRKYDV